MFKRLSIGTKILLAFAVVAIVTVGTIAFVTFTIAQTTLERESFNKLTAVREMKANQIEDYFQLISDQIITQSKDIMIVEAMKEFSEGYQTIETEVPLAVGTGTALTEHYQNEFFERLVPNLLREITVEEYLPKNPAATILQDLYILSNPFETGSKHLQDNAGDGSSYSAAHELYHPIIRDFLDHFGYYDIFLVDLEGNIVYSVFKEVDFGTSLTEGPYSETNFARAVRAALEAEDSETVIVEDFEPYHPSYNAPAAFMASPIFDGEEKIGVLVFQAPIERINNIMTNNQNWADVGLGDSGETYLIGPDFLLRNQSRFLIEDSENYFRAIDESGVPLATMGQIRNLNSTIGLQEVDTEGTQAALAGETGSDIFPDYRGVNVLSAYKPLDISGLEWVIMSEIDEAEAFASINWLALRLGIASIALIAFIAIAAYFFSRSLTRPLSELTGEAEQLSYGVLDSPISNRDRKDEIGLLAKNFEIMRVSLKQSIDDLALLNKNLENKVIERTAELEASEERIRSIVEIAPDAIISIDGQQNIIMFNSTAEEIFGFTVDEVLGQPLTMLMPEASRAIHPQEVDGFLHESTSARSMDDRRQLSGRRKDGSIFPAEAGISKLELDGQLIFTAFFRDITERKRLEAEIANQLAFVRTLIDTVPNPIFVKDPDHRYLLFNRAYEEAFGIDSEALIGKTVMDADHFAQENIDLYQAQEEVVLEKGGLRREEYDVRYADGQLRTVIEWLTTFEQSDGSVGGLLGIMADITQQKKLEAEIANQLTFVRTLIDTVPNSIFAVGPDQRYILLNRAYEEAYGMEAKDQLGKTVMDIETLPLEVRESFRDQNLELLEKGGMIHDEIEILFADGELHNILQWVTAFEQSDGTIGGLVGITADITEIKELERELAIANERMSTELNFARDIQISMLPLIFPAFPDRREVTVHAALDSAREVGGDFYDFYFLDDDHLCFVVGDVSGKGAPGALMMAVSKTLIKSRAADDNEPASILTHVNDELSQDNVSSMFVTVFLGILNVKTGEFVYTNAGHNPPYIRRKNGSIQKIDAFHGPVIGAMPGMPYDQDRDVLHEGDVILVYSDGVTEAFNEEDQLFSEERLEKLLQIKSIASDRDVVEETKKALTAFVGNAEQSDDITLLAVQYLIQPEMLESQELHITIKNRYEDMAIVEERFAGFVQENELPDTVRQTISVVLDEMLNNVISYAYQGEKEKDIQVGFELSGSRLVLTIKDSGVPFNPFARKTPDTTLSIEEREIGGLGIHMVRNMMDEVSYQRQINKNVVTLVKHLDE